MREFKEAIECEIVGEENLAEYATEYPNSPNGFPLVLKDYIKIMHSLGFLQINRVSANEEQLLTDLWNLAGGTEESSVDACVLLVLLAGLMNLEVKQILRSVDKDEAVRKLGPLTLNEETGSIFFTEIQ